MSFRLRKLYADAVLADGAVVVVYLAWLDFAGLRTRSAAIEWYAVDGTRRVFHALDPPAPLDPDAGCAVAIELVTPHGRFRLEYAEAWSGWVPGGEPRGVAWRVLQPRAGAHVSWTSGGETRCWQGLGYADFVELRRPLRLLRLRSLAWGRAHDAEGAVVYTAVQPAAGDAWMRAARWRSGALTETTNDFRLERTQAGGLVMTVGRDVWLRLSGGRTLHRGAALDRERFPRFAERAGARLLAGPVHETRWNCCELAASPKWRELSAVHEYVQFGRPQLLEVQNAP